mmetsp:Transcript_20199/g.48100  ORF Transcript_20199/g.48100 Transcript_20199/m.48100 type:complete len:363 (-) Transcript_20199:1233-2321(-)
MANAEQADGLLDEPRFPGAVLVHVVVHAEALHGAGCGDGSPWSRGCPKKRHEVVKCTRVSEHLLVLLLLCEDGDNSACRAGDRLIGARREEAHEGPHPEAFAELTAVAHAPLEQPAHELGGCACDLSIRRQPQEFHDFRNHAIPPSLLLVPILHEELGCHLTREPCAFAVAMRIGAARRCSNKGLGSAVPRGDLADLLLDRELLERDQRRPHERLGGVLGPDGCQEGLNAAERRNDALIDLAVDKVAQRLHRKRTSLAALDVLHHRDYRLDARCANALLVAGVAANDVAQRHAYPLPRLRVHRRGEAPVQRLHQGVQGAFRAHHLLVFLRVLREVRKTGGRQPLCLCVLGTADELDKEGDRP